MSAGEAPDRVGRQDRGQLPLPGLPEHDAEPDYRINLCQMDCIWQRADEAAVELRNAAKRIEQLDAKKRRS